MDLVQRQLKKEIKTTKSSNTTQRAPLANHNRMKWNRWKYCLWSMTTQSPAYISRNYTRKTDTYIYFLTWALHTRSKMQKKNFGKQMECVDFSSDFVFFFLLCMLSACVFTRTICFFLSFSLFILIGQIEWNGLYAICNYFDVHIRKRGDSSRLKTVFRQNCCFLLIPRIPNRKTIEENKRWKPRNKGDHMEWDKRRHTTDLHIFTDTQ